MDVQRKRDLLLYLVKRLRKERLDNGGFMTKQLMELVPGPNQINHVSTERLWLAFRALANVREPWPADHDLLAAQDELLQGLIAEAGITAVGATAASPLDPRLRLWRGDITTLAADAIVNAANDGMTGCCAPLPYCIEAAAPLAVETVRAWLAERDAAGLPTPTVVFNVYKESDDILYRDLLRIA